jgi:hypothetical protein
MSAEISGFQNTGIPIEMEFSNKKVKAGYPEIQRFLPGKEFTDGKTYLILFC